MQASMEQFHSVQQYLGLSDPEAPESTPTASFIFVSIDLEYNPKCITELGISIFDPQTLNSADLGNHRNISNEYPISSVLYSTRVSRYKERRRKPSHFGKQYILISEQLRPLLKEILTPINKQGSPMSMIIVGHNVATDINVIKSFCGLDISRGMASVKTILDTECISQFLLGTKQRLSLKHLLKTLNLEYVGLHNAMHDSRYTLRALLYMICIAVRRQSLTALAAHRAQDIQRRIGLVEKIAMFHRRRERITWCENSPRVKFRGNSDMLDREVEEDETEMDGLLAGIV